MGTSSKTAAGNSCRKLSDNNYKFALAVASACSVWWSVSPAADLFRLSLPSDGTIFAKHYIYRPGPVLLAKRQGLNSIQWNAGVEEAIITHTLSIHTIVYTFAHCQGVGFVKVFVAVSVAKLKRIFVFLP